MDWYRAWVGACSDEKITEAKLVCELPRVALIALWHALLESACRDEADGAFSATPRRLAAVLEEPVARIDSALAAFTEVGLIRDGAIVAWAKRQPNSETPASAAERQRRHRERQDREKRERDAPDLLTRHADVTAVTGRHGASRRVTAPESESETDLSSSASSGREAEIDLAKARPLPTRDPLEAEARTLMGEQPVVVDPDFSPISALLDEPGVTRGDVIAGLTEAAAAPNFRPVSWRQCAGWVRKAAKNRLAAAAELGRGAAPPGRARAPPGRERPQSALSVCLEIAKGAPLGDEPRNFADETGFGAGAGPVIDGRAVAL